MFRHAEKPQVEPRYSEHRPPIELPPRKGVSQTTSMLLVLTPMTAPFMLNGTPLVPDS